MAELSFNLDGRAIKAHEGELIISAAERAGTFIPRFCYHPRMKPVGMCRMCLVEVSSPRGPTLQPACFVEVAEGMDVTTDSPKVKKAQDGVLEFLLVNHPLDCPVCDKGGECPLQDQTIAYGPGESRFVEEKRHFEKPVAISELVLLDRERCIQCARCTRFAEEIAGEAQIDFAGRGDRVEVATFPGKPFSSYFSGNTVQICPVGALTATPYRFAARPWDLDQVESTCTTCALGCRIAVQSSSGQVTRTLGVDDDAVNQSWLCDKGRFSYEAITHEDRIMSPMVRRANQLVPVSWDEALKAAAEGLSTTASTGVIGGAKLTNESAYAWAKLAKSVLGTDSVDAQLGDGLPADLVVALPRASIDETCQARAVLVLSGDLREELPVLFLRLSQAAKQGTPLLEASPHRTSLSSYATESVRTQPGEILGVVKDLVARNGSLLGVGAGVVVVLGRPSLAEHESVIAEVGHYLAGALPGAKFLPALRRGNVFGAIDMGLSPGLLPGRVGLEEARSYYGEHWGTLPRKRGVGTAEILDALASGPPKTPSALIALGADLIGDFSDAELARRAISNSSFLIAVTGHQSPTTEAADVVFPAAIDHERSGTVTNLEGRVTRVAKKVVAPAMAWPDWMIAVELARALGADLGASSEADLFAEITSTLPAYKGISEVNFDGQIVPVTSPLPSSGPATRSSPGVVSFDPIATPGISSVESQGENLRASKSPKEAPASMVQDHGPPLIALGAIEKKPVQVPHADGYALRLVSNRVLYDDGSSVRHAKSLSSLIQAASLRAHPHDLDRVGASTGDKVRCRSSRTFKDLPVIADDQVQRGTAIISFNLDGAASELIDANAVVNDIKLESIQ